MTEICQIHANAFATYQLCVSQEPAFMIRVRNYLNSWNWKSLQFTIKIPAIENTSKPAFKRILWILRSNQQLFTWKCKKLSFVEGLKEEFWYITFSLAERSCQCYSFQKGIMSQCSPKFSTISRNSRKSRSWVQCSIPFCLIWPGNAQNLNKSKIVAKSFGL